MLSFAKRLLAVSSLFSFFFFAAACEEDIAKYSCCECKCYALNIRGCDPVGTYTINSSQSDLDCDDTCFERCNIQLLCSTHEANSCE